MKPRVRSILNYFTDFRSILVGFAIFNITITLVFDAPYYSTCAACSWDRSLNYLNEAALLLAACVIIQAKRWWSNTVAVLLAGYLIVYFCSFVFYVRTSAFIFIFLNSLRLLWKVISPGTVLPLATFQQRQREGVHAETSAPES